MPLALMEMEGRDRHDFGAGFLTEPEAADI
jgi:hypothetical protein